jgi:uncharacterized membrane protein YqjE
MAGEDSAAGTARAGGLLASVKGLAATLIAAAHTRLQLFANELASEGRRLRRIAVLLVLAVIFFALALVLLTLLVVVMFWDGHRLLAIGGLAVAYLAAGGVLAFAAGRCASAKPRPFEATLGEFRKDHERLSR